MSRDTNFARPSGPGIHSAQVNAAREMVAVHLHGRGRPQPRTPAASSPPFPARNFPASDFLGAPLQPVSVPARNHRGNCSNPQCRDCGRVVIPLPVAQFPFREKPSISVGDWSIYTQKGSILLLDELDRLNATRFDFPLPEMIFGHNLVRVVHDTSGACVEFNTLDALDALDPESSLKVSYHQEWLSTRPRAREKSAPGSSGGSGDTSARDLESVKPHDWTYTTKYRGTVTGGEFCTTEERIPLEKLTRPDPILFYDEAVLYEDELGDNGILMLLTKIRVMPLCLLLLCRLFLRVDDVAVRVRDTRVYVDFDTGMVLREHKVQEAPYADAMASAGRTADPKKLLRDANWVAQNTPVVSTEVERLREFGAHTPPSDCERDDPMDAH